MIEFWHLWLSVHTAVLVFGILGFCDMSRFKCHRPKLPFTVEVPQQCQHFILFLSLTSSYRSCSLLCGFATSALTFISVQILPVGAVLAVTSTSKGTQQVSDRNC